MPSQRKTLPQLLTELPNKECRRAAESLYDWSKSEIGEPAWPPTSKDGGYSVRVPYPGLRKGLPIFKVVVAHLKSRSEGWLLIHWKENDWASKIGQPLADRIKNRIEASHIALENRPEGWRVPLEGLADAAVLPRFVRSLEDVVAMIRAHTAAPPQEEIPEKDEQERNAQAAALAPTMVDLVSDESRRPNDFDPANFEDGRTLFVQEIVRRQGQGAFRQEVLKAYQGRCAISGCRLEHVLEAAHIQPYLGPNTNHVTNGLLLRSDLHTLFDLHLIAINPSNWTVVVSGSIRDQEYTRFHGEPVALPKDPSCCPNNRVVMDHLSQLRP